MGFIDAAVEMMAITLEGRLSIIPHLAMWE